jgi:hypothetical protein
MILAAPIKQLIADNAPAFAAIGARVYAGVLPQQPTYPACVVQAAGTTPYDTKSGVSTVDAIRMQVDVYADTLTAADAAAELIRTAIDRYRGDVTAGALTWSIDGIRFLDAQHLWEDDPRVYRALYEYQVRILRVGTIAGDEDLPTTGLLAENTDYLLTEAGAYLVMEA